MNKKYLFLTSIMFIIFLIMVFNINISYASDVSDIITGGDSFIEAGKGEGVDQGKLKETSNLIYKILIIIGMAVAIVIAGILGMKFMMGSIEDKAQVKDQLIPFIVGCVVIFMAFSIWKIAVNIGSSIGDSDPTSVTYTKKDGKLYCDGCGDELSTTEQRRGQCGKCHQYIEGI